jgi:hypothetical protein
MPKHCEQPSSGHTANVAVLWNHVSSTPYPMSAIEFTRGEEIP